MSLGHIAFSCDILPCYRGYQEWHLEIDILYAINLKDCLWLKNLPLLIPTNDVSEEMKSLPKSQTDRIHYMSPGPERAKMRSKTYTGIAEAMANQWSQFVVNKKQRSIFKFVECNKETMKRFAESLDKPGAKIYKF